MRRHEEGKMGNDLTHNFLVIFTHLLFHNMKIGAGLSFRPCNHITIARVWINHNALKVKPALFIDKKQFDALCPLHMLPLYSPNSFPRRLKFAIGIFIG